MLSSHSLVTVAEGPIRAEARVQFEFMRSGATSQKVAPVQRVYSGHTVVVLVLHLRQPEHVSTPAARDDHLRACRA